MWEHPAGLCPNSRLGWALPLIFFFGVCCFGLVWFRLWQIALEMSRLLVRAGCVLIHSRKGSAMVESSGLVVKLNWWSFRLDRVQFWRELVPGSGNRSDKMFLLVSLKSQTNESVLSWIIHGLLSISAVANSKQRRLLLWLYLNWLSYPV